MLSKSGDEQLRACKKSKYLGCELSRQLGDFPMESINKTSPSRARVRDKSRRIRSRGLASLKLCPAVAKSSCTLGCNKMGQTTTTPLGRINTDVYGIAAGSTPGMRNITVLPTLGSRSAAKLRSVQQNVFCLCTTSKEN